ncbi:hypothetical protein HDE_05274 [Halotydeus destructor]|nr:hypothetical protein HDE_05274 [Halotydeus destructor]
MFIGLSDKNEEDLEAANVLAQCCANEQYSRKDYQLLKANPGSGIFGSGSREFYLICTRDTFVEELSRAFDRKSSSRPPSFRPYHAVPDEVTITLTLNCSNFSLIWDKVHVCVLA